MSLEQRQIVDSLISNELTKRLLANVDGCKIYAVGAKWWEAALSKAGKVVTSLREFEEAFIADGSGSIFVGKDAGLLGDELKTVIKANSQMKTVFVEV